MILPYKNLKKMKYLNKIYPNSNIQNSLWLIYILTVQRINRNKVAAVAVVNNNNDLFSARLPELATIFTARAKVIKLDFEYIRISKNSHFKIFSDSLPCFQTLHDMNIDHSYISSILYNYHQVVGKGQKVKSLTSNHLFVYKLLYHLHVS